MAFLHQLGALIEHLVDDRRLGARDVPREVEIREAVGYGRGADALAPLGLGLPAEDARQGMSAPFGVDQDRHAVALGEP